MTTFNNKGLAIEQYDAEMAIEAIVAAPSQSAAESIFRLLNPTVKAQLRRAAHAVAGERQEA